MEDKTELHIYSAFKKQLLKLSLAVENKDIVCDKCKSNEIELCGSPLHPDRKYKCLKCDRVFRSD